MSVLARLRSLGRNLLSRRRLEQDLDDEIQGALAMLAEEHTARGMRPAEARRAAAARFGGVEAVKAGVREARAGAGIDAIAQDLRSAVRLLRRNPLFALTAALSLAVGIGATTTIFTVANGVLMREPSAVRDPDRIIDIFHTETVGPLVAAANPQSFYPVYLDLRERTTTLEDVFAYELALSAWSFAAGDDGAERIFGVHVSPNYFEVLGVRPAAGRLFGAPDGERAAEAPVAVLSHAFWSRRFHEDPGVVGRTVTLNGQPFTIVGVAGRRFSGISVLAPEIWVPAPALLARPGTPPHALLGLQVMMGGRLKPEITLAQARAEIEVLGRALQTSGSRPRDLNGIVVPGAADAGLGVASTSPVPGNLRLVIAAFFGLLMVLVALVLVIACANVAGVLLARGAARRREIAVRLAVGVSRGRLVRQLLTETLLLFALGCAGGVLLAGGMTAVLTRLLPAFPQPVAVDLSLDWRVFAFAVVVSVVAAVLSGLAPALQSSRRDVIGALKDESHAPPERLRLRSAFVVVQVAFSLVLVIAAGLFVARLQAVAVRPLNFDPTDIHLVSLDLSMANYTSETGPRFVQQLLERARALPGVREAAAAERVPSPGRIMTMRGNVSVPGVEPPAGGFSGSWTVVEPGYFGTLRIPIVSGRDFGPGDDGSAPPVVIVSSATAKRLWPGREAVGQIMTSRGMGPGGGSTTLVVVGVASDIEGPDPGPPGPRPLILYAPRAQRYSPQVTLLVRASAGARAARAVAALVQSMDSNLPVLAAGTLEDELTGPVEVQLRVAAAVSGAVGIVGLLLATLGVHGVTAYVVTRRTREIGVRLALGADRSAVTWMVLRQGMTLVVIGSVIGLTLAAGVSRVIAATFFRAPAFELATFAAAVLVFGAAGLVACYVPVRRAGRISATEALRYE